ncbi:hypothetical protein [Rhodococcus jostii]|uniref:hypothetical protein n=1 Tax=Rhodococcus jostii TaxID=132919 RepID=UPI003634D623
MTHSTKKSRLHRLLKLAYAPLVAAVAAGAICTGAGTGTAASTTTPGTTDAPQSGDAYNWALFNRTGQPIYGYWNAEMPATGDHSRVETDKDRPWQPDVTSAKATQYQYSSNLTTWTGHICYKKQWWDYTFRDYGFGDKIFGYGNPIFRLEADSAGTPWVYFDAYSWGVRYADRHPLTPGTGSC